MSEFFNEAERGYEIIEYWLTAAKFLMDRVLIGFKIMNGAAPSSEIAGILETGKNEYACFLARRETPASAAKNASLIYDPLIEFFK